MWDNEKLQTVFNSDMKNGLTNEQAQTKTQ